MIYYAPLTKTTSNNIYLLKQESGSVNILGLTLHLSYKTYN